MADEWQEAAAEADQDAAEVAAAQEAERRRLTQYREPNMAVVGTIDEDVRGFLGVVRREQGDALAQSKAAANAAGKAGLQRLDLTAGRVDIITTETEVTWKFYNPDFPNESELWIRDDGWWRFVVLERTSSGGVDDVDQIFIMGRDDTGSLNADGEHPFPSEFEREARQSMASYLRCCGLPLPRPA